MLLLLFSCTYDAHFYFQVAPFSRKEESEYFSSNEDDPIPSETETTEDIEDIEERDIPEIELISQEFLAENSPYDLIFEERHDAPQASLWNYPSPSENGFFFTTMFSKKLTLRAYDFDFNLIQEPTMIATVDDLQIKHHFIADHATLYHNDTLYYTISANNDWNLILISSDLEGNRLGQMLIQEDHIKKANDPQLFSFGDNICVRWGESGYEKAYRCFDTDLNPLHEIQIQTTSVPTSQLGSTVWTGEKFIVFSGDDTQTDMIISQFDEEWNELEPFQQIIIPSQYDEWNWASTGVAWIPEYELWAVAYTNMPSDGGGMDGRGRIALFDKDFTLLSIKFVHQQDKGTFRTHLIWHEHTLIVSYDAGPVIIERWDILPL